MLTPDYPGAYLEGFIREMGWGYEVEGHTIKVPFPLRSVLVTDSPRYWVLSTSDKAVAPVHIMKNSSDVALRVEVAIGLLGTLVVPDR